MFVKLVFLAILALVQGRPEGHGKWEHLEPHHLCPPAEVHWLLPHETDCTLFYYCEYGLKWKEPRQCAEGTEFSYEEQVCVHPDEANCHLPGSPTSAAPPPNNATTTTAAPTNAPTTTAAPTNATTTSAAPTSAPIEVDSVESGEDNSDEDKEVELLPNGCPADYINDLLLPHADCDKFYQCTHGEKVVRNCPEGEHFNVAEQKCDWPENAGCETVSGGENGGEDSGNGENGGEDGGNGETDGENGGNGGEDGGNGENGGEDGGDEDKEVELLPNGCPADYNNDLLLPHAECGKFYQCVHGEKVVLICPEGEHFNVAEQKCDWPEHAGCEAVSGGEDGGNGGEDSGNGGEDSGNGGEDSGNGGEDSGNGGEDGGNGENGGEDGGDEDKEVELLPNGCPADYNNDLLLPHAECGKFYQCAHGEKVVMRCPEGEHFNAAEQKCDWPEHAGCEAVSGGEDGGNGGEDSGNGGEDGGNGGEDGGNGGEDSGNGENGGEDGGDEDKEVELLPNGCPADYNNDLLLPHAECGKFYQCAHGEKVVMRCPEGQHFNVAEQKCDWPEHAGCEAVSGGEDGGNGGEDGGNGGEDGGNGENGGEDGGNGENGGEDGGNGENGGEDGGDEDKEVELLPNGCPADYNNDLLLPHADCGKFYQCAHGEKVVMRCPVGQHFNVAEQKCDWPEHAGCEAVSSGEDGGNGEEDSGNGGEDGGNGGEDSGNGGEDGGNGENGGEDGGDEDKEVELLPNGCPADYNNDLLLPHADCGKFYQCAHGEKVVMRCPVGQHFNVAEQKCDWPEHAGCEAVSGGEDGGNGGEDGGNGGEDGGNGGEDGGNGGGNGENGGEDSGNGGEDGGDEDKEVELLPNGCPADFSVHHLLPHENDCGKFYYCVWGELVERECHPGTHFNPALQICDWPWNAGCASGDNGGGDGDGGNGENGNRCADGCNVLPWAHATDCDKFWRCSGEVATLVSCSEGLRFNAATRTCDHASNVSC